MTLINLLNQSSPTKSVDENSANLINLYLVNDANQGKYQTLAYPTPGATLFSAGSSVMRAEFTEHGITYGIDGNTFFSTTSGGTRTTLGTLNTSTGWAKIRGNLNQLLIADSSNGYYFDIPTQSFSNIATSTSAGLVQGVIITSSGVNYSQSATCTISGGGGSGALATVNVGSGTIASVNITSQGTGYLSPTVTFTGGGGTGAAGSPVLAVSGTPTISGGGTGYVVNDQITANGGAGSASLILEVLAVSSGAVTAVSVFQAGSYTSIPGTSISQGSTTGSGSGATFSAIWKIIGVQMSNFGANYISAPTVTFADIAGSGAVGTATINSGVVTSVSITNPGSGYTSTPTITFSDSTGTGAAGTVTIATNAFPNAIQDIECQDEFGMVMASNSQNWFTSAISNLASWPQLSFASTTGNQNFNIGMVSVHREIYLLGTQCSEVWDNLGTINFSFGRNSSVFIEYGCAARSSIAKGNNTFFMLAQSPTGGRVVVSMNGYTPEVISPEAINYQLSTYSTVADANAFIYQQEGHEFYVLTLPTANVTWVFDIGAGIWHQRQSSGNAWLASCYTYNYDKCLVGDSNTGNIYSLDMGNYTENGASITRTITTHPFYATGGWMFADKLQIDFDNAPGLNLAQWSLFVSRDGGRTYGNAKPAIVQQDANNMYRVYWNRLGVAHAYTFILTTSANMQTIVLGAWANVRMLSSV